MFSLIFYLIIGSANLVSSYKIILSGDENVLQGETVQFKAEVVQEDGTPASDVTFKFEWSDNASPSHSAEFETESPSVWNVTYNSSLPGKIRVSVKVYKYTIILWSTIGNASKIFHVRPYVQDSLVLSQGNITRKKYISNTEPVIHKIVLQKSHLEFLNKTTNFLRTFWFVDCVYYGQRDGFEFPFNFTKTDSVHHVEALLVATYIPPPTPPPTTTTTTTTTTTKPPSSLTNSTEATISSNSTVAGTNTTVSNHTLNSNSSSNGSLSLDNLDEALVQWLENYNRTQRTELAKSDYCINSSVIPMAPNYVYGFFRTNFVVKAPVKISPINGTNWLRDGEVLNITVFCNGSSPYSFCILLKEGLYNVTGKETCKEETIIRNCSLEIHRLFKRPTEYTLVVIISNVVSHVIKPIAVNIYKVKKHAQLSVIIVPVSFSLLATTLIIFGFAYYVQSKRKYTIEVADFDFGNQTSNMEYKSFGERLRESISNSLLKSHDYQERDDSWPESASNSRKYGSME